MQSANSSASADPAQALEMSFWGFSHKTITRFRRTFSKPSDWSQTNRSVHKDLKTHSVLEVPSDVEVRRNSSKLGRVLEHHYMQNAVLGLVFICTVQMGFEANLYGKPWDTVWSISEQFFVIAFTLEMVLKLAVDGCYYFHDGWNIFDFVIVWTSIIGLWILPLVVDDESGVQSIRVLRMLRIFRLGRLFEQFPELSSILNGLFQSIKAVSWALLVLALLLYLFSILAVEFVGKDESLYPAFSRDTSVIDVETGADEFNPFIYFGTLERSMVSLIGLVLLAEWTDLARPIWEKQPWMIIVFMVLVVTATLGVLNIVIGIVCDKTNNAMAEQKERQKEQAQNTKYALVEELATAFCKLDSEDNSYISWRNCQDATPEQIAYIAQTMDKINFPPGASLREIFRMLDLNGDGRLSKQEFIRGFYRVISCDEFQRDCVFLSHVGQIIAMQANSTKELQKDMRHLKAELMAALSSTLDGSKELPVPVLPPSSVPSQMHRFSDEELNLPLEELMASVSTATGRDREDLMESASAASAEYERERALMAPGKHVSFVGGSSYGVKVTQDEFELSFLQDKKESSDTLKNCNHPPHASATAQTSIDAHKNMVVLRPVSATDKALQEELVCREKQIRLALDDLARVLGSPQLDGSQAIHSGGIDSLAASQIETRPSRLPHQLPKLNGEPNHLKLQVRELDNPALQWPAKGRDIEASQLTKGSLLGSALASSRTLLQSPRTAAGSHPIRLAPDDSPQLDSGQAIHAGLQVHSHPGNINSSTAEHTRICPSMVGKSVQPNAEKEYAM